MATPKLDYFDEIMVDHNNFRDLHERFNAAYKEKNAQLMNEIANTLVREASIHTDAEEISIYNVLDSHGFVQDAEHDRAIHHQLKTGFAHIDTNSTDTVGIDAFHADFESTCTLLFTHAEEEENNQYKRLSAALTAEERANLAVEYLKARQTVSTRPHPMAPQSGGVAQMITEKLVKPVDYIVTGLRSFVELKHKHTDLSTLS